MYFEKADLFLRFVIGAEEITIVYSLFMWLVMEEGLFI